MNGFCAPNRLEPFNQVELDIIKAGNFQTAKLMDYHTMAHVSQLRAVGVGHFLARLPTLNNTADLKLDRHINKCWDTVVELYQGGACNIFQVDNEPNRLRDELGWRNLLGVYSSHMRYVMRTLQARCDARGWKVYWVLPPLSYAPALWDELNLWKTTLTVPPDHEGKVKPLAGYCDYAGANCYWQYERFMLDGSYGMAHGDVHNWSGLPVIVVEYGYTGYLLIRAGAPVTMAQVYATMRKQYRPYVLESARRGVAASYVFQVGGTEDWAGLAIPLNVAKTLSAVSLKDNDIAYKLVEQGSSVKVGVQI